MTTSRPARLRPADARQARDAAGWLALAASPSFALMAWVSAEGAQDMPCASGPGLLPIGGMAWMYLMMSLFHLSPWLRRASARSPRGSATVPQTEGD